MNCTLFLRLPRAGRFEKATAIGPALIASGALAFCGGPACANEPVGSAAVSHYVSYVLPSGSSNSSFVSIADLAGQNADAADHQIVIEDGGQVFAVAQVHIENPAGIGVRGACALLISDGTGPQSGLSPMSQRAAVWYTTDNPAYDLTVPVVGFAIKEPGKYNVVVECEQLAFTGGTRADLNQLIVWRAGAGQGERRTDRSERLAQ